MRSVRRAFFFLSTALSAWQWHVNRGRGFIHYDCVLGPLTHSFYFLNVKSLSCYANAYIVWQPWDQLDLLHHPSAHLVCWNPDRLIIWLQLINQKEELPSSPFITSWSGLHFPFTRTHHEKNPVQCVAQQNHSEVAFPPQTWGRNTGWLILKKHTRPQCEMLVHGILLEKQNVKTSMYNLECRSTEQNSWTGPGLAAPTHTHTQTHTQTQDRNAAKDRPRPHLTEINTLLKWWYTRNLKAIRCTRVCFSRESHTMQQLILVILAPKLLSCIIILKAHPSPPNSLRHTQRPRSSYLCPTHTSPSKKGKHTEDKASILTCQKHRV